MNGEVLKEFVEQAEAWKAYFLVRVRVVLAVQTEGSWSLWFSYTAFLPEVPEHVETFSLETTSIRAFRDVLLLDKNGAEAAINEIRDAPETLRSDTWTVKL